MLKRYSINTADDYYQVLREIMQEIALAELRYFPRRSVQ